MPTTPAPGDAVSRPDTSQEIHKLAVQEKVYNSLKRNN